MALSQERLNRLKKSQNLQEAGTTGVSAPKATQQKVDANIARREDREITPERQRQIEEAQRRANQAAQSSSRSQAERNKLKQVTIDAQNDPLLANKTREERDSEIRQRKEQEKLGFESTQQKKLMGSIRDEYGQQLESGYSRRTGLTREGELFSGYRQEAIDQQKASMGPIPERPSLPDDATYEDRLRAEAQYNQDLANYYQGELGASQEELGTVSGQVTSLADQITQNQEQIDQLINSISAKDPQKGQQTQEVITELSQMGLDGEITPEAIAQVSALIDQGIDPRAAIEQAFGVGAPAPVMDTYAPATAASAFTSPEIKTPNAPMEAPQVIPSKEPEPFKPDGSIVNTQFGVSLNGNTYSTPSGLEIPRNVNTGFPDYNSLPPEVASNLSSYDLFAIDVATGQFQMASQNADLQAFYTSDSLKKMTDRIQRDSKTYYDQITSSFDSAEARVSQEKVFAIQEQELAAQRLEIEKDMSIQSLNDGHAKNESIMKAMVDAYGLEGSSAQLAIMGNLDLKYRQQLSQTKKAFAVEGAQIALNSSKIRFDFANQLVDLTNKKNDSITAARNELTDRLDEVDSMRLASQIERTQSRNAAYQELAMKKGKIVQDAQAREAEAQQAAMDRMFEVQTEGIKASGYIPTIGPDGTPSYMMDENGQPIYSLDAKKTINAMNKMDIKTITDENGNQSIVMINPYTGAVSTMGQNAGSIGNSGVPLFSGLQYNGEQTFDVGGQQISLGQDWSKTGLPGSNAECVGFSRFLCPDLPYGLFSIDDKRNIYSDVRTLDQIEVGDAVFFNGGSNIGTNTNGSVMKTGHAAVITQIYEDGTADILEANYENDPSAAIIGTRRVDLNSIDRAPDGRLGVYKSKQKKVTEQTDSGVVNLPSNQVMELNQYDGSKSSFPWWVKSNGQRQQFVNLYNEVNNYIASPDTPLEDVMALSRGKKPMTQTQIEDISRTMSTVDRLDLLNDEIDEIESDYWAPVVGAISKNLPQAEQAQRIKALQQSLVADIARGVFGEVGVLTDQDIERYMRVIPDISQVQGVRQFVGGLLQYTVESKVENQLKALASTYDVSGVGYVPQRLNELSERNAQPKEDPFVNFEQFAIDYNEGVQELNDDDYSIEITPDQVQSVFNLR